ncbi:MAG: amidase [Galactobacter sp.]
MDSADVNRPEARNASLSNPDTTRPGHARRVDGGLDSAVALRTALRAGETTSVDLTQRCLDRIEERNPELGSFVALDPEGALERAAHADELLQAARADGTLEQVPALTGLPTAFKDLVEVKGFVTTYGTAAVPHVVSRQDAPIAARLRAAGANVIGKTAVPEFGLSTYSENRIHPPARNPLDPKTSPGGSSGGAAAAVTAGMLPFSPGNDGGGSVRIPASACGLVGLKTGLGTLPEDLLGADGSAHTTDRWGAPRLATTGPLGRDAADAALLLDGLRFDADAPSNTPALDAVQQALTAGDAFDGLKVGVTTAGPFDTWIHPALSPEARAAYDRGVHLAGELGAHVEESSWVPDPGYPDAFRAVWTAGLADAQMSDEAVSRMGALARAFRHEATHRGADTQRAAATELTRIAAGFRQAWGRYDILLTPAMAQTPRPIGYYFHGDAENDYELQCRYTPYTSMVNVSGLPSITVPVLWTPDGYSMSVQMIGRSGSEVQLLRLAALLQRAAA